MIFLILLTIVALVVLILGFLEIKLPFISSPEIEQNDIPHTVSFGEGIREKLVKDSVKETLRNTKFFQNTDATRSQQQFQKAN